MMLACIQQRGSRRTLLARDSLFGSTRPNACSNIPGSVSAQIRPRRSGNRSKNPSDLKGVYPRNTGQHAHNFFLQTWYELGVVGAILFAVAGVVLILRISHLPLEAQSFAAALFATVATSSAFAWSLWQTWLCCLIGLLILYLRTVETGSSNSSAGRGEEALALKNAARGPNDE